MKGREEVSHNILVAVISDCLGAVDDGKEGDKQSSVPVISHPASIVALASQVGQCFQWYIVIVIQEHLTDVAPLKITVFHTL